MRGDTSGVPILCIDYVRGIWHVREILMKRKMRGTENDPTENAEDPGSLNNMILRDRDFGIRDFNLGRRIRTDIISV